MKNELDKNTFGSPGAAESPALCAPRRSLTKVRRTRLLAALALLGLLSSHASFAAEPSEGKLRESFANPPADSRPMMRWWWFGPAVNDEEVERELKVMKAGGIGGVEIQPVYALSLDDPSKGIKNTPYLSAEFLDRLHFAAEKGRELGMRVDLTIGSGWPYGGPHIPIDLASSRLRFERAKVAAGSRRVVLPSINAGEKLIAVFPAAKSDELRDIRDGAVWLPENDTTTSEVWVFLQGRTGQQVKRAGVGAEGFVLDHYNQAALEKHLKEVGDRLLKATGKYVPFAVFCDSLEVYAADWTDDFLSEFQRRRGYDLRPKLPSLVSNVGPDSQAIRHDWGVTLTELFEDRFAKPLGDWAHSHHTLLRFQMYGVPPAVVSSNRLADINEGEGDHWDALTASRWASSASHIYGRTTTSSETWTWLHSPVFRATPLDMKVVADRNFLQGVNQLVGHGWAYSPPQVDYPGWRFYAAAVFNDNNPWYSAAMPDLMRYLSRASYLLRQGAPVNDVAVYLPNHDGWASFSAEPIKDDKPMGKSLPSEALSNRLNLFKTLADHLGHKLLPEIIDAGYNFDFFDDRILRENGIIEKNVLSLGKTKYKAVILPSVERIPVETLKKLDAFAAAGGVVIAVGRKPDLSPGLQDQEKDTAEIRELTKRMFEGSAAPALYVADESDIGHALMSKVHPDVRLEKSKNALGFVHRSTNAGELYFLANTKETALRETLSIRGTEEAVEQWNPLDGSVKKLATTVSQEGSMSIQLELAPYESTFVMLAKKSTLPLSVVYKTASEVDLSRGWQLTFDKDPALLSLDDLKSWTELPARLNFSGSANYVKTVTLDAELSTPGAQINLDFGAGKVSAKQSYLSSERAYAHLDAPVREVAVVTINGKRAGSVWSPPYALNVTSLLKKGENKIEVEVANLAVNYMAEHAQPDYTLLNLRYGLKFDAQDMDKVKPEPAGLLGPVHLVVKAPAP